MHSSEKMQAYRGKRLRNFHHIISWHIFELFSSVDWDGLLQLKYICLNTLLLQGAPGGTVTHCVSSSFCREVSSLWFVQKYQAIIIFSIHISWEKYGSFLCILVSWLSLLPQHKCSAGTGQSGLGSPLLRNKHTPYISQFQ